MSLQDKAGYEITKNPTEPKSLFGDGTTPTGDVSDCSVQFETGENDNLVSGSKLSVLFGKIKHFITNIANTISNSINATGSVDTSSVGTPSVTIDKSISDGVVNLDFQFHNLRGPSGAQGPIGPQGPAGQNGSQGPKGDTGATPNITGVATVDNTSGNPSCNVTTTGTQLNPVLNFSFTGLKGPQGAQGIQGIQGIQGPQGEQGIQGPAGQDGADGQDGTDGTDGVTPSITATASYETTQSGTPSVNVTKTGTDEAPVLNFTFNNIKGDTLNGETEEVGGDTYNGTIKFLNLIKDSIEHTIAVTIADLNSGEDKSFSDTFLSVPSGGSSGQVLKKHSAASGDYAWENESGGGGGSAGFTQIAHGTLANEVDTTYGCVLTPESGITHFSEYADGVWILLIEDSNTNYQYTVPMVIINNSTPGVVQNQNYQTYIGGMPSNKYVSFDFEFNSDFAHINTDLMSTGSVKLYALKNN